MGAVRIMAMSQNTHIPSLYTHKLTEILTPRAHIIFFNISRQWKAIFLFMAMSVRCSSLLILVLYCCSAVVSLCRRWRAVLCFVAGLRWVKFNVLKSFILIALLSFFWLLSRARWDARCKKISRTCTRHRRQYHSSNDLMSRRSTRW